MQILGLDIGGSGIKGAPVDIETGELLEARYRIPTPQPATPKAMIKVMVEIVQHFNWEGKIGVGFPAAVQNGITRTAANVDKKWVDYPFQEKLAKKTGCPVYVVNDADAAGLAEMRYGAGKGQQGLVVMITLGTGIGTAAFINGRLIPNLELGHIEINGEDAEFRAAESARDREDLSWAEWAERVDYYLYRLEQLIWPDLYIIGGGVSKKWDARVEPHLKKSQTRRVIAENRNEAGIIGAALAWDMD